MDKSNLSDEIIKVIDELAKRFGMVVDWTQQNIMPQVKDLLNRITEFEIRTSIFGIVIASIFLIIAIIAIVVVIKKDKYLDDMFIFIIKLISSFTIVICIIVICVQTYDIIKAQTLPETVWIEYLKSFSSTFKGK